MNSLSTRFFHLSLLFLLFLSACSAPKIHEVLDNPDAYSGKPITLEGEVTSAYSLPMVNYKVYELADETGSIYVMTIGSLPKKGKRLKVEGELEFYTLDLKITTYEGLILKEGKKTFLK